jgi:transposase
VLAQRSGLITTGLARSGWPVPSMPPDAARDAVIVMQARVIEALAAENTRLAGQVADLAARVERLERLASRNSGNSSMPPSADDLPGRTPRRKPSADGKRKPGKQPGSHLAWSEYPDDKVPHFPAGACECGADLADARDLGVAASHQQVEIPLVSA